MGAFKLPRNQQMVQGFPVGRLTALENRPSGDRYRTISTTSHSIVPTGTLTFTVDAGLAYTALQDVSIVYDTSNHMHGEVVSYSGTTLVVDIQHKTGSGTYASWVINLDGIAYASWVINLDGIASGGTPAGSNGELQYNNSGAFGGLSNSSVDDTNKRLGLQVSTPQSPLHVASVLGTGIADVTAGSASLVTETIYPAPTGTITVIDPPSAGSGGSVSYIDTGSGTAIATANGTTYYFRIYPTLDTLGIKYKSPYYEEISYPDPNDGQSYNIQLNYGSVSISGETVEYYIEYSTDGSSFSPYGVVAGTAEIVYALTGSDPTSAWSTFYKVESAPTAFTGGSAQGVDIGSGGISEVSNTILLEVDSVKNINGLNYASGTPTTGSFSDSGYGTYNAEISWTDNGNATNGVARISIDSGATWYYQFTGSSTSPYVFTSLSNDSTAEAVWGVTAPSTASYSFAPYGITLSPAGVQVFSSVGTTYGTSVTTTYGAILKHNLSGLPTDGAQILAPQASPTNGRFTTTSTFYDAGYTTWVSGTTVTPTSYGFTGTAQNRDYKVYGFRFNGTIYSQVPHTLSTTSSGGSKSVSLSWTLPTGITQTKILRQVNGGGYTVSKSLSGGVSTTTDDSTDTGWAGNTTITPNSVIGTAGRFDRTTNTVTEDAQLQIVATGTGVRYSKITFGIAPDSATGMTRISDIYTNSSTGHMHIASTRLNIESSTGGTITTIFGSANIINNNQNSSVHFQVKGLNASSLINTRSDQDTVGFGQAIGSDQSATVQIQPHTSGDAGLVMIGHASQANTFDIFRTQTSAGSFGGSISVAGAFKGGSDSASNPAHSWRSDSNTGFTNPTTDTIGFVTGGSERARLDSSGRFGIGLTSLGARLDVTESTLGNAVYRLQSTATNDDPNILKYQNRVATTNNTVTTLHTVATTSNNSYIIEAKVLARRTGGSSGTASDTAGYKIIGVFKNNAGTLTQVGTTTVEHSSEDQAGWDCVFTISGTSVLVRVTGATNNNVTWHLVDLDVSNLSS